ncbi:SusF/SusE family outer membrane protein [Salegentibacter sp. JZCK2]|uniref:SusF/SusE family outer membrane protein n=1 Tax=Salegentibacter tibetensis TaxID=2873600 RepID=UPI001CC97C1F|nr:SusF/SusE family outer membrane protein [Salegentibacter tibetensis]MBZ9730013.1 SusF/SusE family outer membrane protein [Salegentibacter tibetensis]
MKKFSILFLAFIALLSFNACTQDDDIVFVAQPDPEGIQFSNSFQSTYVLPAGNPGSLAERFVWNEVDFDAPTTITYELQGSANETFDSYMVIGNTGSNNLGVTVGQMRELAEEAGLDNDPETEMPNTGTIYFKVRAFAGEGEGNALEEFSEPVSINVELPEAEEEEEEGVETKRNLYLVGDATEAGWNPDNNNTPMFRDPENDNVFYFTGYFAAGFFKFLEGQAWAPQYGSEDGSNLIFRETEADPDPPAIEITSEGYYSVTVDLEAMTFSFEPYDASGADTFETIGVIGTATTGTDEGWNADMDLTQSSFNPHIWYSSEMQLFDGEMKFRANDAWDVNWGGDTAFSGEATTDGPNIPVSEGTYQIWFNDLDGKYILIPVSEE